MVKRGGGLEMGVHDLGGISEPLILHLSFSVISSYGFLWNSMNINFQ